jgi:hypothetical protein
MLPPKRLLWMLAGLAVCLALYQVYLFFLGGYDGLTPLPAEYWPGQKTDFAPVRDTPNPEPPVVRKLRLAFGPQAKEADRPILIESVQHGLVLAAQKAFLNPQGKLELEQVAVAFFGKKKSESAQPDIATLQGDRAIIEFDKPLTSVRDVANRKPVAGRIEGRIDPATGKVNQVHLRHHRRTPNPDDDLHLFTDWLEYDDRQHRIWTEAAVEIVDGDPETGKITGVGLEVLLETEPSRSPPAKPSRATITGVRSVELASNVQMYFQVDAHTALFGGIGKPGRPNSPSGSASASSKPTAPVTTASTAAEPARKPARRSPVKVIADGPFLYRVPEDRAEFYHRVHLIRIVPAEANPSGTQLLDELRCQSLTLQFRRKNNSGKSKSEDSEAAVELVSARAVGEPLELTVESEGLHATGSELVLDRGSNSAVLVGKPLEAIYDGHRLQVTGSLTLRTPENQIRELREAQARGPGTAWLRGRRQSEQLTLVVRWREQMRLERDGSLERLLLSGNVLLEEPQRGSLRADHLLLWLELAPPGSAPANGSTPTGLRLPRTMVLPAQPPLRLSRVLFLRKPKGPLGTAYHGVWKRRGMSRYSRKRWWCLRPNGYVWNCTKHRSNHPKTLYRVEQTPSLLRLIMRRQDELPAQLPIAAPQRLAQSKIPNRRDPRNRLSKSVRHWYCELAPLRQSLPVRQLVPSSAPFLLRVRFRSNNRLPRRKIVPGKSVVACSICNALPMVTFCASKEPLFNPPACTSVRWPCGGR